MAGSACIASLMAKADCAKAAGGATLLPLTRCQASASPSWFCATSSHQSRSSIIGSLCATTLRKLPTHSPSSARASGENHSSLAMRQTQTTAPSLKIGRYIETTMPPMSTPRMTMMNGSIRLDRPLTISSTSSS
jgi:hypothetical protein